MTSRPEPIIFKCEASLWEMLADGSKTFEMRRWDLSDARIYRLSLGHLGDSDEPLSLGEPCWFPDERTVSFLNKATRGVLTFAYKGMEFEPWAPGWCFLLLGRRIEAE